MCHDIESVVIEDKDERKAGSEECMYDEPPSPDIIARSLMRRVLLRSLLVAEFNGEEEVSSQCGPDGSIVRLRFCCGVVREFSAQGLSIAMMGTEIKTTRSREIFA